jgi:hypothetical protein
MAGPARDDGGVKVCAAARATRTARWPGPVPVAVWLVAGIVLAGCATGIPAGGARAPGTVRPSGSASASSPPGTTAAGGPDSSSNGPDGTASPVAGGTGSGSGCTPWPAGSTRTALLITRASNGRRYCVRTGETVRVSQAGTLSLTAGSEPPRLTGTSVNAEEMAYTGGTPVGAQCQLVQMLRVTIVVT